MSETKILELGLKGLLSAVLMAMILNSGFCQTNNNILLLEFKYGFQAPLADMKSRFGGNNDIGISIQSSKLSSAILFGFEGIFIFGSTVKEDVVENLRTFDGTIIGIDGHPGDVNLKERGFYVGINSGKIFKTTKVEHNLTGIRAQIGGGILQHKIRVQENSNTVPALDKKYLKGYDRLSNGPAMHLAIGYQYENPKNNFHFNIMGDLYGARTLSRRDFDSLSGGYLDTKRTDILAGASLSYIVSISRTDKADHIYY